MPRHELDDALNQSEGTRNIVQAEKTVQTRKANVAADRGVQEDALQLRTEIYFTVLKTVVQGLNAHSVASENKAAFGAHPDGNGKHPAEPGEARATPAQKGIEDDLRIAPRLEDISFRLQLSAQFDAIENLTVEDNDNIAIKTEKWLISVLEINDAQASRAQRDVLRAKSSSMVRPPVGKGLQSCRQ